MASLGSLVVSLAMDTAQFAGDVGKAAQQMTRLTAEAGKIGLAIGTNIGVGLKAIGHLVLSSIEAADAQSKLAQSFGTTTEEFSQLSYAADLAGVSQQELGTSLAKLARQATDAAAGGKSAGEVFSAMGVQVKDANGKVRGTTEILGDVADKFKGYETSAAKTALATELFGKAGARLIPFLNQGKDGLAALAKEADMLGITLSTSAGNAAEEFNDNLTRLSAAKEGLGRRIAEKLLPTLQALTTQFFEGAKSGDLFGKAAEIAATGVKLLLSAGTILVGVFKTIGDYLGGAAAQAVAFFSGNWAEAVAIGKAANTDFVANITGTVATLGNIWSEAGTKIAGNAEATGTKIAAPVVTAAEKVVKERKRIKTELEKLTDDYAKQIMKLQFDVDTQGASDRTKKVVELAEAVRKGLNPQMAMDYLALYDAQEKYRKSAQDTADAERRKQDIMAEGARVTEELRTPLQVLLDQYEKYNFLLSQNAINGDTYRRGIQKAQEDFEKTTEAVKESTDQVNEFAKRGRENIQNYLGDSLFQAMRGNFRNILDAFVQMIQRMIAEALAAKIVEKLFGGKGSDGGIGAIFTEIGKAIFGGGGSSTPTGGGADYSLSGGNVRFGDRANGGPVSPGRMYMVGERGPEPFIPATAGNVLASDAFAPKMAAASPNVSVVVNAPPGTQVERQETRQGPSGTEIELWLASRIKSGQSAINPALKSRGLSLDGALPRRA